MASKQIKTGTPGGATGGAYGKPDSKGTPVRQAKGTDINDNIGTPGGRQNAPKGARWNTN